MVIQIILLIIVSIGSFLSLPFLPSQIPMHWNVLGEIDSVVPKETGIWYMPLLLLVMIIGFRVLPNFDPHREKYTLFRREWEIMQIGFTLFFSYMQGIIIYLSLHPEVSMMPFMFFGMGALFILIGNYLSKIRQNYFIGIKVPWTLASEDNWNKTHRYASWCFVLAGIVTIAEGYLIWYAPVVIFGSIMLAAFLPIVYSFLLYRKKLQMMRYVYIAIFVIVLAVVFLRMVSREDDWMCTDGAWVRHGVPTAPRPTTPCR